MADEQAGQKVDQAKAMYQPRPQDGERCADCEMFLPPNGCSAVAGEISPSGWCPMFEKTPVMDAPEAGGEVAGPRLGNVMGGQGM